MFKRVVVGVDGELGGRDAIAFAQSLIHESGELTLANVWTRDGSDLLERERAAARVDAQLQTVDGDSIGLALHELTDRSSADLLVVGSSRRGLTERVFLGGVTRAALHDASCPVAVAPRGYSRQPHPVNTIGIGYNGSPESEQAVVVGRRLAAKTGARLSALEVVSTAPRDTMADFYNPGVSIARALRRAKERIAKLGDVEPHAVFGTPSEELALYSGSLDLLIVGSRDNGAPGRLLLGSTSLAVARSVRCALLVLPRVEENELALDEAALQGVG